jgi:hypothetical protein
MEGGVAMLLSELVTLVESDVPAEGGVPSSTQYEQAVKDAVRDFSERCGVEQLGTLSIVSGTATYDLPADFLTLIVLETFMSQDGVLISSQGLIPVSANWEERFTIRNGQITFKPTPTYSMARDFRYKAAWILTEAVDEYDNAEYETLGAREGRIVVLKAKALVSTKKANAVAGDSIKYSFGAVSEDLSGSVDGFQKDAFTYHGEYVEACDKYNGAYNTAGGL